MNYRELGFEILKRRRLMKLSQHQLAEASGISRNYISLIERGEAENISVSVLDDLGKALGVEASFLVQILERGES